MSLYLKVSSNWKKYEKELIAITGGLIRIQYDEMLKNEYPKLSGNLLLYSESQKHNSYFNRKLYIGRSGEIKNASESEDDFGNIKNINSVMELKTIIEKPDFQKHWFVHKESCDICKDCELRHMCVDNRVPYHRTDGMWYFINECNYNPYISKWKGEEGYQKLNEIGVVSDEKSFHRDDKKITKINKVLWSY